MTEWRNSRVLPHDYFKPVSEVHRIRQCRAWVAWNRLINAEELHVPAETRQDRTVLGAASEQLYTRSFYP